MNYNNHIIRVLIINALVLLSFFLCNGNEITEKESGKANKTEEKAFNAGEMIIEHIVDA
ncbi:MAG: hypothetical protein HGB12_03450, partial [Bacteroidetes bacterium]|nr:hypothetical protein [Bacteroidota bacterium]